MTPITAAVLASVDVDRAGIASGVLQAFRQFGAGLGVSVMSAVIASHTGHLTPRDIGFGTKYADGFTSVLLLAGLVALAGGVVAFATIRSHVGVEVEGRRAEAVH
jgi:hypothetical protein